MKKTAAGQAEMQIAIANFREKTAQLQNDLDAARKHIANYRESELKLVDRLNVLINQQRLADARLQQMTDERNDWRDAFKLIMKLVK